MPAYQLIDGRKGYIEMSRFLTVIALYVCVFGGSLHARGETRVCDPRDFGAKADGATKDTRAIQSAIDDCARKGGGIVKLSGGTFLSGPIESQEQHHTRSG